MVIGELWVLFFSVLVFVSMMSYMYVGIDDRFADKEGNLYRVYEKNMVSVKIANEYEEKSLPLIFLTMRYDKIVDE